MQHCNAKWHEENCTAQQRSWDDNHWVWTMKRHETRKWQFNYQLNGTAFVAFLSLMMARLRKAMRKSSKDSFLPGMNLKPTCDAILNYGYITICYFDYRQLSSNSVVVLCNKISYPSRISTILLQNTYNTDCRTCDYPGIIYLLLSLMNRGRITRVVNKYSGDFCQFCSFCLLLNWDACFHWFVYWLIIIKSKLYSAKSRQPRRYQSTHWMY